MPTAVYTPAAGVTAPASKLTTERAKPPVTGKPPVKAAEVVGSVSERDLLDALFAGKANLADPVEKHMGPGLPLVGSGEVVAVAVTALEHSDAVIVVADGMPSGVLTRQDLLGYLAI